MIGPREWGIAPGYRDAGGEWVTTSEAVQRALLAVMEADSDAPPPSPVRFLSPTRRADIIDAVALRLESGEELSLERGVPRDIPFGYHELIDGDGMGTRLIVSPGTCVLPKERMWGLAVQLYAARSRHSWGIGDLADLKELGWRARGLGARALMINPLHAADPGHQQESPYFPSSRCFLNPLYLRVGSGSRVTDRTIADALNSAPRIERDAIHHHKMSVLEATWRDRPADPGFDRFRDERGELLEDFATFMALRETQSTGWHDWPGVLTHPRSPAVLRFRRANEGRVSFHCWLQYQLDAQLAAAARTIGVVHDLAIGVDRNGADAWMWQDAFAAGVATGAPPDPFSATGQDWGLPPFDPWKLRSAGYEPFVQIVRTALRHGAGARIDHVMGLFRLFWVPDGSEPSHGGYVNYPAEDLLDIVALESHRADAFVVGEDLGTVEDGVREEMARRNVLGTRVVWFEDGPPAGYPELTIATVTNHDLPTIAGLWTGADAVEQRSLGLDPDPDGVNEMRGRLVRIAGMSNEASLDETIARAHAALDEAPSVLALATLEDALAVPTRPNIPGTGQDVRPNWSIPLPQPIESFMESPRTKALASELARSRPAPRLNPRRVALRGGELHVVEAGEGPPVLLLHGFPDFWYSWREQIFPLADAGFRVVAPDLRGYNASFQPRALRDYSVELLIDDVAELVRSLGGGRAHVVGHDWGAIIAWYAAMWRPEIVDRLAILNVPHPARYEEGARDPLQLLKSWYIGFFQLPWFPELSIAARDHRALRQLLRRASSRIDAFTEEDIDRYVVASRRSRNMHGPIDYYRAYVRRNLRKKLRELAVIDAPVLVLWGDRDPAIRPTLADPPARWVPNKQVMRFPDAGHWVHIDKPGEVNRHLLDFLSS